MTLIKVKQKHQNRSKLPYYKISKMLYFMGSARFYYEEFDLPAYIKALHNNVLKLINISMCIFFVLMWSSFLTQPNLNERQWLDRIIFSVCVPVCYSYAWIMTRQRERVRNVVHNLVKMREVYNDIQVDNHMARQAKIFSTVFVFFMSSVCMLYGVTGLNDVIVKGENFVTIITVWPDVTDTSYAAGVARIIFYIILWICVFRMQSAGFLIVILLTIAMSNQFRNLCSYFRSLNDIFDAELSQNEKQEQFEKAFKVGIDMHSRMIWCTKATEEICKTVYAIQILINIVAIVLVLFQFVTSERTLTLTLTIAATGTCTLISTGCFWWTAGNITVEASQLSMAMFSSGWQHCRRAAARRIRPVVVIAMWQSQVPVVLHCLGIVELSHQSYLVIVRITYSIFSVMY